MSAKTKPKPIRPEPLAPMCHTFPARLRAARERAGLSQSQLAAAAGMRQNNVSRFEAGLVEPGLAVLRRLARALGMTMDDLAG